MADAAGNPARWPLASFGLEAFLGAYSQVLLCNSRLVGAVVFVATCLEPRMALHGAAAVFLAMAMAKLLYLSDTEIRRGTFGYNALLIGLGGAALLEPSVATTLMTLTAAAGSVLVTAALKSALTTTFLLPVLTLPFLAVFYMLMGSAPLFDIATAEAATDPLPSHLSLPTPMTMYLRSLGAIFFAPGVDVGLGVLLALAYMSRIGVVLSVMGFGLAWLMGVHLIGLPAAVLPMVLGYNFMLTAIALGGVWFVPSRASFILAAFGSLVCGLVGVGLYGLLASLQMSLLILPFNLTVLIVLHAMRQRTRDVSPKSVDTVVGTPEENLHRYQTRVARWGGQYLTRFNAPFRGQWVCTQSIDGPYTHRGLWRHALDFEVLGRDGRVFSGEGERLDDYHCYTLPVTAPARGTVITVVNHVPDNPVGEANLVDNWGNLVLLYHAPGLYSLLCHLVPGSVAVKEGQIVLADQTVGLCGNSGRSPYPHLHFHLQATARVGAPTIDVELHNVIRETEDERLLLESVHVPAEGGAVRNIEVDIDIARRLDFKPAEDMVFESLDGGVQETIRASFDLYNNRLLLSEQTGATLTWDRSARLFVIYDVVGARSSMLHMIHAALARVPFEKDAALEWSDVLPRRRFLPWVLRPLLDLASPFWGGLGLEMRYRMRQEGSRTIVEGSSTRQDKNRGPFLKTRAELSAEQGLVAVEVSLQGKTQGFRRVEAVHEAKVAPELRAQPSRGAFNKPKKND